MIIPTVAWSDFARERHVPGSGRTWFEGTDEELLDLVRGGWTERRPGAGRHDLDEVVVVPLSPERFHGTTVLVTEQTPIFATLDRRQSHEEPFIRVTAAGPAETPRFAGAVLYSAACLLENDGRRSSDADWEVVCLLAGATADEPLDPVTMARNFLEKPGGTYAPYTAQQFAEAIWYWNRRANRHQPEDTP